MKVQRIVLDLPAVAEVTSLSKATVQELVRQGQFPKARALSSGRVGWLLREIEQWAESRPVSSLLPPPNTARRGKK